MLVCISYEYIDALECGLVTTEGGCGPQGCRHIESKGVVIAFMTVLSRRGIQPTLS